MALLMLDYSSTCRSSISYNSFAFTYGRLSGLNHENGSLGGPKVRNLKILPCGSMVNWKKHKKKQVGFCGYVTKSLNQVTVVKGKPRNRLNSEEVIGELKSFSDLNSALSYFKSLAELPYVVHTTETCNYMLEVLRIHGRIEDMAVVFDLMQKQIINRDLGTYLTIFKGLCIKGGIRLAPLALEKMRETGIILNAYSYNGLIHLILQSGFFREALVVYRRMVSEGIKPSLKTYSALMVASGKRRDIETFSYCGDMDAVKEFWSQMEADGYAPDVVTFTILVDALCKAGDVDKAFGMLDAMKKEGVLPNLHTYNTLISGLLRLHRLEEALELFSNMEPLGVRPTAYTYILFIDYYGKSADPGKALETFEKMKSRGIVPNIVACNASLYGLAEAGRLGEAKTMFNWLKHSGLAPDSVTYNMMMKCYSKVGQVDEAIKLTEWVRHGKCFVGMKDMKLAPSVVTYNTLLAGLGKEGKVQKAIELFDGMVDHGCFPDTITFNTLLDCLCKNDEVDLALKTLCKMTAMNCSPDVLTYNTIIYGLVKEQRVNDAIWFFHQMKKWLYPDYITLFTLIPGVVKDGRIEDALKITEHFVYQVGIHTGRNFWKDLIGGILTAAGTDKAVLFAEKLVFSRLCQNDSALVPIIKSLCWQKKSLVAKDVFVKFTKNLGVMPTLETYNYLINGLLEVHAPEIAVNLFKEMKEAGCAPDVSTYNLLLDAYGKSGEINELFKLYEEMPSRRCKPNTVTHNIVISGLVKSNSVDKAMDLYYDLVIFGSVGMVEEAGKLYEELQHVGLEPNVFTYNALIRGCSKSGNPNSAYAVYKKMMVGGCSPNPGTFAQLPNQS
ncbi:hypothetical protein Patl1_12593 [Pistacia atlantica]|uniref:Uncharacterized protein n=1 Tax=Pistacia atlantica TaxID=434234 RepID=A0ACC1AVZ0_9ROSI|nr:hypothetical protein Patl1_12593 [Pistacia atlantica]